MSNASKGVGAKFAQVPEDVRWHPARHVDTHPPGPFVAREGGVFRRRERRTLRDEYAGDTVLSTGLRELS